MNGNDGRLSPDWQQLPAEITQVERSQLRGATPQCKPTISQIQRGGTAALAASGRSKRGRPRRPILEPYCKLTFQEVVAELKRFPARLRPAAKDKALAVATRFRLNGVEHRLFSALLTRIYWKVGYCQERPYRPTTKSDLVEATGHGLGVVKRGLKRLEAMGLVAVLRNPEATQMHQANIFTVSALVDLPTLGRADEFGVPSDPHSHMPADNYEFPVPRGGSEKHPDLGSDKSEQTAKHDNRSNSYAARPLEGHTLGYVAKSNSEKTVARVDRGYGGKEQKPLQGIASQNEQSDWRVPSKLLNWARVVYGLTKEQLAIEEREFRKHIGSDGPPRRRKVWQDWITSRIEPF